MKAILILLALVTISTAQVAAPTPTITFRWENSPAIEKITNYRVYQRKGDAPPFTYQLWVDAPAGQNTFVTQGVAAGVYTFVLRAVNSAGEGPDSDAVTVAVVTVPGKNNTLTVVFSVK